MTALKLAALLAAGTLASGAAGCGGDGSSGDGGSGGGGGAGATSGPAQLFDSTCGGCHTLKAAGSHGQVGPDLDQLKPDKALVLKTIKEGPSVMPANLLTGADADKVATYVADNAGK